MKRLLLYTILLTTSIACKKTISVELQDIAPQIVIEGTVTNATTAEVIVSKSVPFSHSNSFPKVSAAVISITDNGVRYELTEIKPGTYRNNSLIGIPGHTYNLSVKAEGKEYTATSTMPLQVKFDSLHLEKIFWGSESIWVVKPQYKDPPEFGNNYMFIETINGKQYPDFWVWDDNIINNSVSTLPLIQSDSTIHTNDTVEVEMRSVDKNVLRYFTALQGTQTNATTPTDPENKITGGALGYFSAHTVQRKKVIVR